MTKSATVGVLVTYVATELTLVLGFGVELQRLAATGRLKETATGAGIGGKTVYVTYTRPDGTSFTISDITDAAGSYVTYYEPVKQPGLWSVVAEFDGDDKYAACSKAGTIEIPGIPTTLTIEGVFVEETRSIVGRGYLTITETGSPLPNETVSILFTKPDGTTLEILDTTDDAGHYGVYTAADMGGTWYIQSEFLGRDLFLGCG